MRRTSREMPVRRTYLYDRGLATVTGEPRVALYATVYYWPIKSLG